MPHDIFLDPLFATWQFFVDLCFNFPLILSLDQINLYPEQSANVIVLQSICYSLKLDIFNLSHKIRIDLPSTQSQQITIEINLSTTTPIILVFVYRYALGLPFYNHHFTLSLSLWKP